MADLGYGTSVSSSGRYLDSTSIICAANRLMAPPCRVEVNISYLWLVVGFGAESVVGVGDDARLLFTLPGDDEGGLAVGLVGQMHAEVRLGEIELLVFSLAVGVEFAFSRADKSDVGSLHTSG